MSNTISENVINGLTVFPYKVMHESSIHNPNHEIFFCCVDRNHYSGKDDMNAFFNLCHQDFPLKDLAPASQKYLKQLNYSHFMVLIDILDNSSPQYEANKKLVMANRQNILAKRYFGKLVNENEDFYHNIDSYIDSAKIIGKEISTTVQNKIDSLLLNGTEYLRENQPIVKEKLKSISNNLGSKLKAFKSKL